MSHRQNYNNKTPTAYSCLCAIKKPTKPRSMNSEVESMSIDEPQSDVSASAKRRITKEKKRIQQRVDAHEASKRPYDETAQRDAKGFPVTARRRFEKAQNGLFRDIDEGTFFEPIKEGDHVVPIQLGPREAAVALFDYEEAKLKALKPSDLKAARAVLTAMLAACVEEVKHIPGRTAVTASSRFSTLKELAAEWQSKACMACDKVLATGPGKTGLFSESKGAPDGLFSKCKDCDNNKVVDAQQAKRKKEAQAANVAALQAMPEVKDSGKAEDELVQWVLPQLQAVGFVVRVMEEFRRADVILRRDDWPADTWVRIQVKADSGLHNDGETPKPMDSPCRFKSCFGYGSQAGAEEKTVDTNATDRMLMLCGARRAETMEALKANGFTLWCFDGTLVSRDTINVSCAKDNDDNLTNLRDMATDADARPRTIAEISAIVDAAFADATFPKTTMVAALLDVQDKDQRKEMLLMLCLKVAVDMTLSFPTGNQTSVDCVFQDQPTQCKTYNMSNGSADCNHRERGVRGVPYDRNCGIERLVEFFLLKHPGTEDGAPARYFLFYARQGVDDLVKEGFFTDVANGKTASHTSISPFLPVEYGFWVSGKDVKVKKNSLALPRNAFRAPVEIVPGALDGLLTRELLEEVASLSPRPDMMPSEQRIQQHRDRVARGNGLGF
tara:strand:- start:7630 stop:9636 length:2007 start_codon:yes stop_codon:yes gene_type:complete